MFLTQRQILSALKGAPAVYIKDGLTVPDRFCDEQRKGYPEGTCQHTRTYCQANAVLDFHTDSETLTLDLRNIWGENDWYTMLFELLEDGVSTTRLSFPVVQYPAYGEIGHGTRYFPDRKMTFHLKKGEKRVTLYLGHYWHTEIASVELDDGAAFAPHVYRGRFLAFGDSITEGYNAVQPSGNYPARLGRMLDYEAVNYGIGGEHCRPGVITPGTYPECDFVLTAYGTNDFPKLPKETFEERLTAYMNNLQAAFPDTRVYVLLPIWRRTADEVHHSGTLRDLSARIREEAEKRGFRVIDCYDFLYRDLTLYSDGLHPNDEGDLLYAARLRAALKADGAFGD